MNTNIDFKNFWKSLADNKKFILATFLVFSFSGALFSIFSTKLYESGTTLAPQSHGENQMSSIPSSLGSLAGFAGVDISTEVISKKDLAIQTIKSLNFFKSLDEKYSIALPIVAAKKWDEDKNLIILDKSIYDESKNLYLDKEKSSIQYAHKEFLDLVNIIEYDTGVVEITFRHLSPYLAKQILDHVIVEINEQIRNDVISVADTSITYLQQESIKTNISKVLEGISALILSEINKKTLANSSPEYVFKIIDPPFVPEKEAYPNKLLIIILSMLLGLFFGILASIYRSY